MASSHGGYYLPQPSHWPLIGSFGLFFTTLGFAMALPVKPGEPMNSLWLMYTGMAVIALMLFGWFSTVVSESETGKYNEQVDRSFRMGMGWFIFSEVMFFAAFFGALFYIRVFAESWLSGTSSNEAMNLTHYLSFPDFKGEWPHAGPGEIGKSGLQHVAELAPGKTLGGNEFVHMGWKWIPFINTVILLTSGVTITIAHYALKQANRGALILWLGLTVLLGFIFLGFQGYEYYHAWTEMNLKLSTGAYGTTFYMLTGFHGMHVAVGATILLFVWIRSIKGHFSAEHHFAFEAGAWYWHFVDVVWLGLFIFVYWLI